MLAQGIYHTRETARRILEIYTEGRDWFYFIVILAITLLQFGPEAAGQLAVPFFVLHSLSQLALFGFHGHLRHAIQTSEDTPTEVWNKAIKARITILIAILPTLLLASHANEFIIFAMLWLIARFFNEILLAGARLKQNIQEWILVRTLLLVTLSVILLISIRLFSTTRLLQLMATAEALMTAILLFVRISRFSIPFTPRIDFTQLHQALPHFYAQLLFTYNYYYLMIPVALLLPMLATAEIYIQLLILSLGLVPAYFIWNDYRTGRPRMNESELTAATLALGIRGTVISFCIVSCGLFLSEYCIGDIAGMSVVLPQFIILLSHYYTIPTLHALTEEGRILALIRLWLGFILVQGFIAFFILRSEHPNMLFPVMAVVALAQSLSVFLLRNIRYE
ncbi:MAG: hypothetical protein U0Y08_14835 [Bacteroidia bacterium]